MFIAQRKNAKVAGILGAIALLAGVSSALAGSSDDWGRWKSFGNGVSVRFCQVVNTNTWTWEFRNDGKTTITLMEFHYVDKDGGHDDVLPGDLKPGEGLGGWTSFTASSNPTITITKIERKKP